MLGLLGYLVLDESKIGVFAAASDTIALRDRCQKQLSDEVLASKLDDLPV